MRSEWTNKGLAWIETFDRIPLRAILETLRGLEFSEGEIRQHYPVCLRRKLLKLDLEFVFGRVRWVKTEGQALI